MPRKPARESIADADAAHGGVAAVDRALSLLAAFRAGDAALALADLAQRTRLYKSTALRLLASLEHAGWVQRLADGRYAIGREVVRVHAIYTASFSLDRLVLPVLQALVHATRESAAYHVRRGDARLCLYRVDSPHPVRDHIRAGDLLPLDKGTGGRVLCAFDPVQGKAAGRDRRLYARIRADGFYAAVGDRLAELAGISAPVLNAEGTVVAAITLSCPAHRYDERHIGAVVQAARELHGQVD
ncbi:IclR family transcriptional regulator [Verminephrobacter aporrectodeae subsp. tuberculatae]|uniref:IclR family transcriptional regulator n=1 Tax=Verminephrobacter aporrectodeae TaxID=1110389 RepID=UPI0022379FF7|nr:helix-turn-helix domain-containing protein [Verminephrobacter aporrectodeae]MCW5255968.1 IclR family transcriptional regulator [Verminephrobacter aporrectodeae subsp. tuberculatae]